MIPLPIDPSLPRILDRLREGPGLVLIAAPGSGKTTRVPAAIVRSGLLGADNPSVIVLQPRRVATRAVAARIADEQGWTLGREVGYQIRFERRASASTRLLIETEGVLTRQILADPFLESVGAVVLDEFHERSLHTDLALGLLREIRREVRPDLRIIVMSATLDAEPVARFLDAAGRGGSRPRSFRSRWNTARPNVRPIPRRSLGPSPRPSPIALTGGTYWSFCRATAEIRRACRELEPIASGAGADGVAASWLAVDRGAGPGASAFRASQDHRGDEHRRDLADDRRGDDCDRRRARPGRAPRPSARPGPPRPGTDQPGVGRPARREGGADRPRALHPALVRAPARRARPVRRGGGPPRRSRIDGADAAVVGRPRTRAVRLVRAAVEGPA